MVTKAIIAVMIGGLIGILTHAKRHKGVIIKPKMNKKSWNPGFLLDCAFGSIAAVAGVLTASIPDEVSKTMLIAILAGYAGEGLIRKLAESNYGENQRYNQIIDAELNEEEDNKK